ncbi:MAG TPA: hypothetical protein VF240_01970, partial [Pyrinomonadaceae bacterium]
MADDTQSTRERVRALVRDVLENALPAEDGGGAAGSPSEQATPGVRGGVDLAATPRARVIQTAPA